VKHGLFIGENVDPMIAAAARANPDMPRGGRRSIRHSRLEKELRAQRGRVSYVAVTGVSNVTGIVNPVHEIARIAHRYDALIAVDAAQMAAHMPVRMSGHADPAEDLDAIAFSGHKVYAPGSPGVVVARSSLFSSVEPVEVGGGMVEDVRVDRFVPTQRMPDREEAGTPNIIDAIGLGAALSILQRIGIKNVQAKEEKLLEYLLNRLAKIPGVIVYGDGDTQACKRAGALAFNIEGMDHALTAAILNDYFNIAVRNECFCAHPYVREMIMLALEHIVDGLSNEELERRADEQRGMVRASFGIYTMLDDVDRLVEAVKLIAAEREKFVAQYERLPNGDYRHRSFQVDVSEYFSPQGVIDAIWPTP
jgi:cysteine desulfurase/selenocysteine lyase